MKHDNPQLLAKRIRTVARMAIINGFRGAREAIENLSRAADLSRLGEVELTELTVKVLGACRPNREEAEILAEKLARILEQEYVDCRKRAEAQEADDAEATV